MTGITTTGTTPVPLSSPPVSETLAAEAKRLIDLLAAPLADELRVGDDGDESSDEEDARSYMKIEILQILVHFSGTGGPITERHGELLLRIYDAVDPRKFRNYSSADAKRLIEELLDDPQYRELKKPFSCELLQTYDQRSGTKFHSQVRELYLAIAAAALAAGGYTSTEFSAELEYFRSLLDPETSDQPAATNTTIRSGNTISEPSTLTNSEKTEVQASTPNAQKSEQKTVATVATNLLRIAAELDDPVKRMMENATLVGPSGEQQDFTGLKRYFEIDLAYLVSRFSLDDPEVAARRAVLYLSALSVFEGLDPEIMVTPAAQDVVESTIQQLRERQATGMSVDIPPGLQLVRQYDELFDTKNAEQLGSEYLSVADAVAAVQDDKNSRNTLAKVKAVIFPEPLQTTVPEQKGSVDDLLKQLNALVGLSLVKADVTQLANYIKVQQLRKQHGLKTPDLSLHMVFYGNPGTGKTTVARLIASLYRALGVLSKGQLVETDRSGLVAGYVGQTALKVKEIVQRALGGVLFIDEAYALKTASTGSDYGDEAIDTLLKLMEDHRDDLVVVVAGYTGLMERFLEANPGLKSRFNKYLIFEDYLPAQLMDIFRRFCTESDYSLSAPAESRLLSLFQQSYSKRDETFGNARFARNVFERAIANLASRVVSLERPELAILQVLEANDIQIPDTLSAPEKRVGSATT